MSRTRRTSTCPRLRRRHRDPPGRPRRRSASRASRSATATSSRSRASTSRSRDGEFFSMLGPSGSGKTTTLRMIAGFEHPTAGRVVLHGRDVTSQAPFERDVNTVFQDYALFPHMTVGENVGLRPARAEGAQGRARAAGRRGAADGPPRGLRPAQARPAVRRPAPAGRARARAREPAARPAARRAPRRARPQAARGDADRAPPDPARGRDHVHLRDPRPGRGARR